MITDDFQHSYQDNCQADSESLQFSDQVHSEQDQLLDEASASPQMVPIKLREIARQVHENKAEAHETVRNILAWFGAKRRGLYVVNSIQKALADLELTTEPDFTNVYIDSEVQIIPIPDYYSSIEMSRSPSLKDGGVVMEMPDEILDSDADEYVFGAIEDPTFRIGKLESANNSPVTVVPDATLLEATTLMMFHDFSQLPVMQGEREVKGVISWESIGRRKALNLSCNKVRDCMDTMVPEVPSEYSLFSAIDLIIKHGYVLVRQRDRKISGIVTTTDLSLQFRQLAEPFLLVGEIENYIRRLIDGKFTIEQLSAVRNPTDDARIITNVADLTFGEYLRLLENPEYWEILQIPVDRTIFVKKLDRVRELRNDVMHFDPDPFVEEDIQTLRLFSDFMRSLDVKRD